MFVAQRPPAKRKFKKPTPTRLGNIALYYLGRYAASEASLRRVLENRIRKASMQDDGFAQDYDAQEELKEAINDIVEKHKKSGAINDQAFAEMKVRSLRRSGGSARQIALKLRQKGIDSELVDQALTDAESEDPEQREDHAALAYARRRRLGQYRSRLSWNRMTDQQKAKSKDKDYATMARAGFSYGTIRQTLSGEEADDAYEQEWPEE